LLRLGQSLAALKEKEASCAALGEVTRKYPRASSGVKRLLIASKSGSSARERFRAKWEPVRVKKTRQNKNLEPVSIRSKRKRL